MGFPNQFLFRTLPSGGTGNGSSGVNYVDDIFAGDSLSGVNTYNDGASATPTDGTGGVVTGLTTALNSTTPLIGSSSLRFSKDGSNRQGEGWSYDFQIDRQSYETSNALYIQFYYRTSANFASSDMRVFVYDKDSATLLTVQDISNNSGNILAATGDAQFTGVFYSTSGNNDYRLIWHIASTNASAYDVDLDNITVSPNTSQPGAIVTEWAAFTPTGSWTTNCTYSGYKRRIGDSEECQVLITLTGAPDSTGLTINAPNSVDYNKLPGGQAFDKAWLGTGYFNDSSSTVYQGGYVQPTSSANVFRVTYEVASGTNTTTSPVTQAAPFTFGNGDFVALTFRYPVQNWSASAALSATEIMFSTCRVLAVNTAGTSIGDGATVDIPFATETVDNLGAYDGTTFTAPRAGLYEFNLQLRLGTATSDTADLFFATLTDASNNILAYIGTGIFVDGRPFLTGQCALNLAKDAQVKVRASQNNGATRSLETTAGMNRLEICGVPDFSIFSAITPVVTPSVAFTPTLTWVSNTTSAGYWRRVGDTMEIELYVTTTGAPTSANLNLTIPLGLTIDTNKMNGQTTNFSLGIFSILDSGSTHYSGRIGYTTSTTVQFNVQKSSGTYVEVVDPVTQAVPMTWASGDRLHAKFSVPIVGW